MDTTVNYEKITENDSIWSVFKKFFSCSENEDELNEKKIREVESQQDNEYIEKCCKFVSTPEIKKRNSRSKNGLNVEKKTVQAKVEKQIKQSEKSDTNQEKELGND